MGWGEAEGTKENALVPGGHWGVSAVEEDSMNEYRKERVILVNCTGFGIGLPRCEFRLLTGSY